MMLHSVLARNDIQTTGAGSQPIVFALTDAGEVVVIIRTKGRGLRTENGASHLNPQSSVLVAFEVRDTGIGVKPADQAREFGRADAAAVGAREGTRLGLRLSHQLAQLLGGRIEVTSEYGVGNTFALVLPEGNDA
jgi:signal transduction histidine kinase